MVGMATVNNDQMAPIDNDRMLAVINDENGDHE